MLTPGFDRDRDRFISEVPLHEGRRYRVDCSGGEQRLSRLESGHRHRPGRSDWPDQELDHQMQLACPVTVLPISAPDRNHTSVPGKEKNA